MLAELKGNIHDGKCCIGKNWTEMVLCSLAADNPLSPCLTLCVGVRAHVRLYCRFNCQSLICGLLAF